MWDFEIRIFGNNTSCQTLAVEVYIVFAQHFKTLIRMFTSSEQPTSLRLHVRTETNDVSTNLPFSYNTYNILIHSFKLFHFIHYMF